MSLHLVSVTETRVRVCVTDASDDDDAVHAASRLPRGAWREVHRDYPRIDVQALAGVPREGQDDDVRV
jgi:hypothetical protein